MVRYEHEEWISGMLWKRSHLDNFGSGNSCGVVDFLWISQETTPGLGESSRLNAIA